MIYQSVPESFADATTVLQRVRWLLDEAVLAVVRSCVTDGRLDAARLDEFQCASYEIALASAELLAAETACDRSDPEDCGRAPLTRSILHSRSSLQPLLQQANLQALNTKPPVALHP